MPGLEVQQRVMLASDVRRKGVVTYAMPADGGHAYYSVLFDDGSEQTLPETDLQPEIAVHTSWDRLANNLLGNHAEFSIATTLHKVQNTTNNTISSLRASRTLFKPYQYKPLVKFLQSDTHRILVADEVGLGKTIEAGHILLELRGRKLLRNALIVCPKSLQANWQVELLDKFHFDFKPYEHTKDLVADLKRDVQRATPSVFGIVNYEKLRNKSLQTFIADSGYMFDLVVCDESHRLRNSDTQLFGAFSRFVHHAEALLFLTATPIMNDESDLYNQVRLLEPDRYPNEEVFRNAIQQNRPFIRALRRLNAGADLPGTAAELHDAAVTTTISIGEEYRFEDTTTVGELFSQDPLYRRARTRLLEEPDTPATRARIQYDLSELNSLNHLFTRTRKRDVTTGSGAVQRNPHRLSIDLSEQEAALYNEIAQQQNPGLGVVQHKRMITSSIVAYHSTKEELRQGRYRDDIYDSKFEAFRKVIEEVVRRRGKKVIVFSTFRDTLRYLEIKLAEMSIGTTMIHGGIDDRAQEVERFRRDPGTQVLLASEVGREGLNMQFCDVLVNYDLPWNPMRVEQRIGRIDRIGQESPVVNIYAFTLRHTIEERIYDRLLSKINVFREALGDLEEILSDEEASLSKRVDELEQVLYREDLTEAEQNRRIDEVAAAYERQKLDLENIEDGLTDAIVNDIHFQNEINRIEQSRRYLTDVELRAFVENLFRTHLRTYALVETEPGVFVIQVPNNNRTELFDFIDRHRDPVHVNPELDVLYRRFKQKYYTADAITVTFSQEVAYEQGRGVEYVNSYHPLVIAAANYFREANLHVNQAYRIGLPHRRLQGQAALEPGHYLLTVYTITADKETPYGPRSATYLHAVLLDLNQEEPAVMDEDVASHVLGAAQLHAAPSRDAVPFSEEMTQYIRGPILRAMLDKQRAIEEDERVRLTSSVQRRRQQLKQFYDNQIQRREQLLAEGRGIRDIVTSEIERLRAERDEKLSTIDAAQVRASNAVVSINHLHLY